MEWDFTPEDVTSGKVDYSVVQFKDDLLREIDFNLSGHQGDEQVKLFYSLVTFMFCTHLALGKSLDSFVTAVSQYFPSKELQKILAGNKGFLEEIRENNKENIEMLRVVIQRRIQEDVEKGIEPDSIVKTISAELLARPFCK
jgi:hypothetical protein